MSKFTKENFNWDGMYLTYGSERKFVARFKHRGGDCASFTNFLIKNFTVEEYFDLTEKQNVLPLKALENKGYVSPTVKKILKNSGFPPTREGVNMFFEAQAKRRAMLA